MPCTIFWFLFQTFNKSVSFHLLFLPHSGSILDSQPSWESGKFQLARWIHRVALLSAAKLFLSMLCDLPTPILPPSIKYVRQSFVKNTCFSKFENQTLIVFWHNKSKSKAAETQASQCKSSWLAIPHLANTSTDSKKYRARIYAGPMSIGWFSKCIETRCLANHYLSNRHSRKKS